MTGNRTIYVDMDDVISETCRGFLRLLQSEFDRTVAFEDVKVFDLGRSFGMSRDELEVFMERAHQPDVLTAMAPMGGALETIRGWRDAGCRIDVMTGRPPSTRAATEAWLALHDVRHDSLTFVDKYGRRGVDPSFDEALTLEELGARRYCLAVEDSAATASFLAEHGVAPVILIDRPWNRGLKGKGIRRMGDWRELAEIRVDTLRK
jgi:uncharacterized HAD superfamily protein